MKYSWVWRLVGFTLLAIVLGAAAAQAQVITSRFDSGTDGWRASSFPDNGPYDRVMSPTEPSWAPSAGRSGGGIYLSDPGAGNFAFDAPPQYLGNKLSFYGGELRYDIRIENGQTFDEADVVLVGGDLVIVCAAQTQPNENWTTIVIPLRESGWKADRLTGRDATRAEFERALGNLTALRIRGEYRNGRDTAWFDNIVMTSTPSATAGASIPIQQGPGGADVDECRLILTRMGLAYRDARLAELLLTKADLTKISKPVYLQAIEATRKKWAAVEKETSTLDQFLSRSRRAQRWNRLWEFLMPTVHADDTSVDLPGATLQFQWINRISAEAQRTPGYKILPAIMEAYNVDAQAAKKILDDFQSSVTAGANMEAAVLRYTQGVAIYGKVALFVGSTMITGGQTIAVGEAIGGIMLGVSGINLAFDVTGDMISVYTDNPDNPNTVFLQQVQTKTGLSTLSNVIAVLSASGIGGSVKDPSTILTIQNLGPQIMEWVRGGKITPSKDMIHMNISSKDPTKIPLSIGNAKVNSGTYMPNSREVFPNINFPVAVKASAPSIDRAQATTPAPTHSTTP